MAMLDRYRKKGGFVQLLTLVETCGPAKQEKFLELIRAEDNQWAEAIKTRLLDVQRVYSWNDEILAEIIGTLQDLTLAVAVQSAAEPVKSRLLGFCSHGRRRKIDDLMQSNPHSPQEVATMHMKIIETVRRMAQDGLIRFEKFDADLCIDPDIEEKLAKAALLQPTPSLSIAPAVPLNNGASDERAEASGASHESSESRVMEVQALKKRITELSKENANLRHELSVARSKLDQIRKIA